MSRRVASQGRSAAGASLLELVVALAVATFALALAADLLLEAQRRMVRAAAETGDAALDLTLARLRADLVATREIYGPPRDVWDRGPLEVARGGHRVRWRLDGERLVRELYDGDGATLDGAVVLRDVALWRWQEMSAGRGVVVIELAVRRSPPRGAVTGPAGVPVAVPTLRSRRLVVALRGDGGGEW